MIPTDNTTALLTVCLRLVEMSCIDVVKYKVVYRLAISYAITCSGLRVQTNIYDVVYITR